MTRYAVICAIVGLVCIGFRIAPNLPDIDVSRDDIITEAFDRYEDLWRRNAVDVAIKLESGDITTDIEARKALSEGVKEARRTAFEPVAKMESEVLQPWSPEVHAAILRGYAND